MKFWSSKNRWTLNSHPENISTNRNSIRLKLVFVETIPPYPEMEKNILYVSMRFATLSHLCPCGCGRLVDVTLDPTSRSLTYDGEYLTLRPSIGLKYPCRSHYSIIRNTIVWHAPISKSEGRWYKYFWADKTKIRRSGQTKRSNLRRKVPRRDRC